MTNSPLNASGREWRVKKIGVIGPGIVGTPNGRPPGSRRRWGRRSSGGRRGPTPLPTSGWKVDAINQGESPIGGVEPDLSHLIADGVRNGMLRATHDYGELRDADVILVCVQTDKAGLAPDYGPLFDALSRLGEALQARPEGHVPLVILESTLAPSSMATVIRDHFSAFGLEEGRDVLLGNSPNRVMPGRLVERVVTSDKIAGGLHRLTGEMIQRPVQPDCDAWEDPHNQQLDRRDREDAGECVPGCANCFRG